MLNVSRIWLQRPPGPLLGGTRRSPEASKRLQEASRCFQEALKSLQRRDPVLDVVLDLVLGPKVSPWDLTNQANPVNCVWIFRFQHFQLESFLDFVLDPSLVPFWEPFGLQNRLK